MRIMLTICSAWSRGMIFASHVKGRGFNCKHSSYALGYGEAHVELSPQRPSQLLFLLIRRMNCSF